MVVSSPERTLANADGRKLTPLEKFCQSFPLAHQRRNGWYAHDDNPRFDFQETPEGNIIVHSWTGSTVENILAMGDPPLAKSDLFAKPGSWSACQVRDRLDLPTLAHYMKLPWQYLESIGYRDGYTFTSEQGIKTVCVKLGGYCDPEGREHSKNKVRLSLDGKPRFLWDINTPGDVIAVGLHRLDMAHEQGKLFIGEGESDAATMWYHGLPYLGIPGADLVKSLDVSLLQGIPAIYIIEEPDQAKKLAETGQGFYSNLRTHLRAGGYAGEIFSIRWKDATGHKDPSDLHKAIFAECKETSEGSFREAVSERFRAAITLAIQSAIPEGNEALDTAIPLKKSDQAVSYEQWTMELFAVPASILSPAQKIVLCVLYRYMQEVTADSKGWKVDADKLSRQAGMNRSTFLLHLSYLTSHLGLLSKAYDFNWFYTGENGKQKRCTKVLYIEPTQEFTRPMGYCVGDGDERNHGGVRTPKPTCEQCGSENVRPYALECKDCGHVTYPPILDSEETNYEAHTVESTLVSDDSPVHPKMGITGEMNIPVHPNLGTINGTPCTPQDGYHREKPVASDLPFTPAPLTEKAPSHSKQGFLSELQAAQAVREAHRTPLSDAQDEVAHHREYVANARSKARIAREDAFLATKEGKAARKNAFTGGGGREIYNALLKAFLTQPQNTEAVLLADREVKELEQKLAQFEQEVAELLARQTDALPLFAEEATPTATTRARDATPIPMADGTRRLPDRECIVCVGILLSSCEHGARLYASG